MLWHKLVDRVNDPQSFPPCSTASEISLSIYESTVSCVIFMSSPSSHCLRRNESDTTTYLKYPEILRIVAEEVIVLSNGSIFATIFQGSYRLYCNLTFTKTLLVFVVSAQNCSVTHPEVSIVFAYFLDL